MAGVRSVRCTLAIVLVIFIGTVPLLLDRCFITCAAPNAASPSAETGCHDVAPASDSAHASGAPDGCGHNHDLAALLDPVKRDVNRPASIALAFVSPLISITGAPDVPVSVSVSLNGSPPDSRIGPSFVLPLRV
jgi:hypothetical protein